VKGGRRKLHIEEIHKWYDTSIIIRVINEMVRSCSMHGREEKFIQNIGQNTCRKETTRKT